MAEVDHGDISKGGTTPSSPTPAPVRAHSEIDEAVILEEEVTPRKHAEQSLSGETAEKKESAAAPALKSVVKMPASELAESSPTPATMSASPHTPLPPQPSTSLDIPLPEPPHDSPIPEAAPARPIIQPQNPAAVSASMPGILKSVKLPERYEQKGAADKKIAPVTITEEPAHEKVVTEIITPKNARPNAHTPVTPVHTLKQDLQDLSREQKVSLVRAVALEEDRRAHDSKELETPAVQQRSKRTFAILFATLLFLTIGGGILFVALSAMRAPTNLPPSLNVPSLLFAEDIVPLPLTGNSSTNLRATLEAARSNSTQPLGAMTRIVPITSVRGEDGVQREAVATFAEFMKSLNANIPSDLLRALSDDFFLGLHSIDENAPLLVIPVTAYDRAFAGMLTWEKSLNADLGQPFTILPPLMLTNGIVETRAFQDLIIRNHDVRALKDDRGEIQLYYAFPNQDVLVIAESPYSFVEILSRLQAGRNL